MKEFCGSAALLPEDDESERLGNDAGVRVGIFLGWRGWRSKFRCHVYILWFMVSSVMLRAPRSVAMVWTKVYLSGES